MQGLKSKRVIITGGASGIGRAIVERIAREGGCIGLFDIDIDKAEQVAAALRDAGAQVHAYGVDIVDYAAVETAVSAFEAAHGPVDVLVNNAGWDRPTSFIDSTPQFWARVIDINLYGALNMSHVVLRRMASRSGGRVVNIASDAGRVGSSGEAVYSACKGGLIALTKTLARELSRKGITINSVCPGPTDTPLLQAFAADSPGGAKIFDALQRAIPMGRLGRPDDYPGLVAFLASDDAAFIQGQTISVSGGLSMHG